MSVPWSNLRRPVLLVILDGFGVNPSRVDNAVYEANTPRLDEYFSQYPHTILRASGRAAGLPESQMGNSEVGHLLLGCGSLIRQDLTRINDAISDGSFLENSALVNAAKRSLNNKRPLHIIGLVSEGGVHSHLRHLIAIFDLCKKQKVKPILHMITDGRDTAPRSIHSFLPM